jgi:hypothetical protein
VIHSGKVFLHCQFAHIQILNIRMYGLFIQPIPMGIVVKIGINLLVYNAELTGRDNDDN